MSGDSPTKRARKNPEVEYVPQPPTNNICTALLTDMYQISMTYAHWVNKKVDQPAVFDLFFRKCPFKGEYCIFAGLDECLRFISTYRFTDSDIDYLRTVLPHAKPAFFDWLKEVDCSTVKIYAMEEGSVVFPREPLLRVEGPLGIGQLLETTLLNLVNYASLVCTNACRMKLAAGPDKVLMEFGLRRAQGNDGGLSASKYSYVGGFHGTSNVQAGKLCGIDVKGTHAHAYVMSYTALNDLHSTKIAAAQDPEQEVEFVELVLQKRSEMDYQRTNEGELAAFISYAQAYPRGLLALVDTYDTLQSGLPNFICVSLALKELGYESLGIRLDSGDLAYLSSKARKMFVEVDERFSFGDCFRKKSIVASNDLSEDVILSLNHQKHEIDVFGIGTNLVTCLKQPALGCVYKLVEIGGVPRIKLSQEMEKLVIPGRKNVYRLYGADGKPTVDVLQRHSEPAPQPGQRLLVRHPFQETKRAYIRPTAVDSLLKLVWDGKDCVGSSAHSASAQQIRPTATLAEARAQCMRDISSMRSDHLRSTNPTPYKVSVTGELFAYTHRLWLENAPVAEL